MKVVKIIEDGLLFEDGWKIESYHNQDCCENHYLSFEDLSLADFEGLDFDLENIFFARIQDYGIELLPLEGWPVRVPGYGSNNGYYSSNISLIVSHNGKTIKTFDVSECQDYTPD